ncbi:TCR/Tet family MFS transporter [Sulfitobacter sp. S190]|uniref:TCR/Tet family MFS transporter n=1 Tax=Sulfitobacter sp. S190 TaxID=2867022 RepID=UPI0021A30A6B|nr:TCR/Tet family MFS transporter [Sulfitobacter sp. S190]UWR23241.1 TCR/Tet family MFS transporter [Sulfitobacter sp. S190]
MKRLPVLFILLTVMIDAMGIGLIVPVMPDLIQDVGGGTLAQAALWGGILSTTFAVMQFVFGPVVGGLSDRFGRRPVLLVALLVMALDYVLMAVAGALWLLLLGRVIGGITAATQSTATAYMADVSPPERRAANFGLVGAAFGAGFVLGPLLGGVLAEYGTRAPFWTAAGLAAGNALFGWMVLKETVTGDRVRPFSWRRSNPLGALRSLGRLPGVTRLLLVYFIYYVGFAVYPAVWAYFAKAQFDWSPATIGVSLGLFGAMMAVIQGGLIRPVLSLLGERGTVVAGHLTNIVAFGFLAVTTSGPWALALTPIAAIGGIIPPALQGMMSVRVAEDAQGELQGALTSASALAMILSPLVMTYTFARFTDNQAPVFLPGAPFALAGLLTVLGLFALLASPRRQNTPRTPEA